MTPFRILGAEATVDLSNGRTITAVFEDLRGEPGQADLRRASFTLSGQARLTGRTMLDATFSSASNGEEPWFQGARTANLAFSQTVWWGHVIVVTGRGQWGGLGQLPSRTLFRIDYRIPFQLPAKRATPKSGHVVGRFTSKADGAPLPRILVRLDGEHALFTDRNGVVDFTNVAPGVYYPVADVTPMGADMTTLPRLPISLSVSAGETAGFSAAVTRAGRIRGVVRISGGGMANVLLEVRHEEQRLRKLTDANGAFDCTGLTPGEWQVRVVDIATPLFHYVERSERTVTVAPGSVNEVLFDVLEKVPVFR